MTEKKGLTSGTKTYQPWGGAALQDWANASTAIVLTDMTRCLPTATLSPRLKKGYWKVIPYQMTDTPKRWSLNAGHWEELPYKGGYSGNMLWAGPETGAPELRMPLKAKGWYAIFVGLFSASDAPTRAWLRLDQNPAPVMRTNADSYCYGNVEEVFFKVAELDESSSLHLSQGSSGSLFTCSCGISHIKLIPLAPEEITKVRSDRSQRSHRKMAATCDGFSFIHHRRPTTVEELLAEVEVYRDTDFGTLILHSFGGDKVSYPSEVGCMPGQDMDDFPRVGDRHFVEAIRELARKKINPMKVLINGAHDMGMKVHVGIRPGWSHFEPFADFWDTPFYKQHPQWHCVDRDGLPVTRMSWAVPQVRKHLIDLLQEQVRFGADGAHIVFNRGCPVVLYEQAFCEMFQTKYDEDPRQIEESDPRIVQMWSDVVTTFMQELRMMLDEEERRRGNGKRLELSIMVLGNEQDNLQFGIDIRRLVEEELVDEIMPYAWGFGSTYPRRYDLEFFRDACQAKGVPFSPSTAASWHLPQYYPFSLVRSFYDGEASGVTIWDAFYGVTDIYQWSVISRYGHIEETLWRLQNLEETKPPRKRYSFHRLGDQIRDGRFGVEWGG